MSAEKRAPSKAPADPMTAAKAGVIPLEPAAKAERQASQEQAAKRVKRPAEQAVRPMSAEKRVPSKAPADPMTAEHPAIPQRAGKLAVSPQPAAKLVKVLEETPVRKPVEPAENPQAAQVANPVQRAPAELLHALNSTIHASKRQSAVETWSAYSTNATKLDHVARSSAMSASVISVAKACALMAYVPWNR